jgi:hypothetical protein
VLKIAYDTIAATYLREFTSEDKYIDLSDMFIFNQTVMFVDSILICMGGISLLKYTSNAVPDLEAVIITLQTFITGTVRKTFLLIILVYVLFGQMLYFILCYYQYGFFFEMYALLRSCIVFLNGFIINE